MSQTIRDGGTETKDPQDVRVYAFDWDTTALPSGVTITTSTFTVEGVRGNIVSTPVTVDQESILVGSRSTQLRLSAGAKGSKWRIHNKIVTDESPAQTVERSFYLLVQDK